MRERIYESVSEQGGMCMASMRLHAQVFRKHKDFTGAHVSLYVRVFVAVISGLYKLSADSSEVQI